MAHLPGHDRAQLLLLPDIRRMAGRFGGLSVPLRRAARKFNRWLAVSAAKSLGLPPQRVGAHRAAFIRAHLDPDPLPHLLPLALLMLAQVARVAGQSCHCQPHTGLNFSRRLLRHFSQSLLCGYTTLSDTDVMTNPGR